MCQELSSFQLFDCFKNNLCFNQERKYIGTITLFLAIDGKLTHNRRIFSCLQQINYKCIY